MAIHTAEPCSWTLVAKFGPELGNRRRRPTWPAGVAGATANWACMFRTTDGRPSSSRNARALLDRVVQLVNLLTRRVFSSGNSIGDIGCALFS
jgi:hypothetical protein